MFGVKSGFKHFRLQTLPFQTSRSITQIPLLIIFNINYKTHPRAYTQCVCRFVFTLLVTSSTATGWNQPDRVAEITSTYQTDVSVRQLQSEPHQSALITFSITLVVTFSLARCKSPPCRQALLLTVSTLPSSLSLNIVLTKSPLLKCRGL